MSDPVNRGPVWGPWVRFSPAGRTRPEYASIFRAECEKCGVWFCPLGGTGPKDLTPDPDSPGLTSKHRVWFCPLGGTGSSPGLTRTKLLQDTIKQYPGLCTSFFYTPSLSFEILGGYPQTFLEIISVPPPLSVLEGFQSQLLFIFFGHFSDIMERVVPCMHTFIHTYIHACIHTCIHACMHACIHT